jgi:hypothetical protein
LLLVLPLLTACGGAPAAVSQAEIEGRDSPVVSSGSSAAESISLPTAAPAAALPEAPGDASNADTAVETGGAPASLPAATSAPAAGSAPEPARPRPMGQEASLRAGEIDDNEAFADYLAYLQRYAGSDVRRADVSERYVIRVIDDKQRPVLDARITIYDGERAIFRGRSFAGGETIFMPRLFDADNATSFRVVAEYGQSQAETTIERGASERVELGLRGAEPDETLRLDLLFLLDTTGSMGDELARIQQTIDGIAARIDAFAPRPDIRYGLVAYKDKGDEYVTRSEPFTVDLVRFRASLADLSAIGGGDTPEAVDEALYEAVVRADWRDEPAVRLIFLVGDAGPHMEATQFNYLDGAREAVSRGVKIYPIAASSTDAPAEYVFRQLAQQTLASFVFLTYQAGQNGGAPGESTLLEAGTQPYSVERLDDLIVAIVERELAAAVGAR